MAKQKTVVKTPYVVTIKHGASVFKGEGDTLLAALKSIKRPVKIIAKSTVHVQHGDKTCDQLYMPAQLKRVFAPLAQGLVARNWEHLLK